MIEMLLVEGILLLPWLPAERAVAASCINREVLAARLLWTGRAVSRRARLEG